MRRSPSVKAVRTSASFGTVVGAALRRRATSSAAASSSGLAVSAGANFIVAIHRRFPLAWGDALELQLHGADGTFREVRREVILQLRRKARSSRGFLE